jgi:tryptophan-rich sensory protein
MRRAYVLLWFLIGCYVLSFAGAEGAIRGLGTWYLVAVRPRWALPFGDYVPLWTLLYGVMAYAGFLLVGPEGRRRAALVLFWLQMIPGALWPWAFFAAEKPGPALGIAVAGWALAFGSVILGLRAKVLSGVLQLPYLVWMGYAAALSMVVLKLNKP